MTHFWPIRHVRRLGHVRGKTPSVNVSHLAMKYKIIVLVFFHGSWSGALRSAEHSRLQPRAAGTSMTALPNNGTSGEKGSDLLHFTAENPNILTISFHFSASNPRLQTWGDAVTSCRSWTILSKAFQCYDEFFWGCRRTLNSQFSPLLAHSRVPRCYICRKAFGLGHEQNASTTVSFDSQGGPCKCQFSAGHRGLCKVTREPLLFSNLSHLCVFLLIINISYIKTNNKNTSIHIYIATHVFSNNTTIN